MKTFITRSLSAVVFAAVMLGGMLWNFWSFAALFLIITAGALWEYYRIMGGMYRPGKIKTKTYQYVGVALGCIIYLGAVWFTYANYSLMVFFNFVPLLFVLLAMELYSGSKHAITNAAISALGLVYVAIPLSLLVYLIPPDFFMAAKAPWYPDKVCLPLGILLMIWANDSFAYIGGSLIGKNKLFPSISPGKSWEGFVVGIIGCMVTGYVLSIFFTRFEMYHWVIIAFIVSVTGTFGDLFESMIKRNAGIKDSGSIMPGHGGFLDRFDAFIFCIPFVFLYVLHFAYP